MLGGPCGFRGLSLRLGSQAAGSASVFAVDGRAENQCFALLTKTPLTAQRQETIKYHRYTIHGGGEASSDCWGCPPPPYPRSAVVRCGRAEFFLVFLLILCLDDLYIVVNGVLTSPAITTFLSIRLLMFVSNCFIYLGDRKSVV